jgi:putative transposase
MKVGCIWQWSCAIIGWPMSPLVTAQLACDALQMALWQRKSPWNGTVEVSTVQQIIKRC